MTQWVVDPGSTKSLHCAFIGLLARTDIIP
jgi:hypothetical protein